MKLTLILFLTFFSLNSFAQIKDSVTESNFEAIKMKSKLVNYNTNTKSFDYSGSINDFNIEFDSANFL